MNQATRREFMKKAGFAAAAVSITGCRGIADAVVRDNKRHKPNLVYIFADQLGYKHCGYSGNEKAHTPNIDRLASEGADFFNAVSTMPVCSAHRASLFTGKYPTTTGMVINELRMNPNHRCFGHILTDSGYETGYIGKWHLYANQLGKHHDAKNSFVPPGPDRLGFDGYWAAYNFNHVYYGAYYHRDTAEKVYYGEGVYETDGQTDLAVDFINKNSKGEKPFALFLSWGPPHDPWNEDNVPKQNYEMFKDVSLPNPPNYKDKNDKYADGWGRLSKEGRRKLEEWRRIYYAQTASVDANLERILKAIKNAGIEEDTIVVFSSDHGEMFGAQGRRAKNIFYEEAARVPFIIRWPAKIAAGTKSDVCLGTVDVMPTVVGLMNLEIPKEVEGIDLSGCAKGEKGDAPEFAFLQNTGACAVFEDGHEWRALRDKLFTYAKYRIDGFELLFDNKNDPYQMNNLSKNPEFKDNIEKYRKMLAEKMSELNDNFEKCTWYRDNFTDGNRIILHGAKG